MKASITGIQAGWNRENEDVVSTWTAVYMPQVRKICRSPVQDGYDLLELERHLHRTFQDLADKIMEQVLIKAVQERKLREQAVWNINIGDYLSKGKRRTGIRLLGGSVIHVETEYFTRNLKNRRGRKRGVGRRGKSGSGRYPVLEMLGIRGGVTPAAASEISRQCATSSSYADAVENLKNHGIKLNVKTVRRISERFAEQALKLRDAHQEQTGEFTGKRVVIGIDGGRIRTREPKIHGRRRQETGRRGYGTSWREPKMCALYEIDEQGKKAGRNPVYEGTLDKWDDAFELFAKALRYRSVGGASELAILTDGALSIGDRLDRLIRELGFDPERVTKIVDFYHAAEKLHEAVNLCKKWSERKKKRWANKVKKWLKQGAFGKVLEALESLCIGRRSGAVRKIINYFRSNRDRMQYHIYRRKRLPIGSGIVESTIRRVVNLRMKGPGIFWKKENAEKMLVLRCYLKSGRWNELVNDIFPCRDRQNRDQFMNNAEVHLAA